MDVVVVVAVVVVVVAVTDVVSHALSSVGLPAAAMGKHTFDTGRGRGMLTQ